MRDKFLSSPDSMPDHELLEILLYQSIPRIDTNAIAHKLLNTFGSLDKLFKATPKEIMSVKGVGKVTAENLALFGAIYRKTYKNSFAEIKRFGFSAEANRKEISSYFNGVFVEMFFVMFLDKTYNLINKLVFTDFNKDTVSSDISEIANAIAINKPTYIIVAHNHTSGIALPSYADDLTTAKLNLLCSSHGVTLLDHVIVAGKESYSYYINDRLEIIKRDFSIDSTLKMADNSKGVDKWIK